MGANTSALLSEEIDEISREENLSQDEVKRLYNRFQKLDQKQSGTLDTNTLMMIPELAMNPLHPRLIHMFANNNFRQFVSNVSALSERAEPSVKADFAFRVYDVDDDGYISADDLRKIFHMLVGNNLAPESLDTVIDQVIKDADADDDGRISRDDFSHAVDLPSFASQLTIRL